MREYRSCRRITASCSRLHHTKRGYHRVPRVLHGGVLCPHTHLARDINRVEARPKGMRASQYAIQQYSGCAWTPEKLDQVMAALGHSMFLTARSQNRCRDEQGCRIGVLFFSLTACVRRASQLHALSRAWRILPAQRPCDSPPSCGSSPSRMHPRACSRSTCRAMCLRSSTAI